jgi:integrase
LSALLFLYREVLGAQLAWMVDLHRPSHPRRIPTVLTPEEVMALLDKMPGGVSLIVRLLYGTGMRLMEAISLRVKDVDFDRNVIVIREAKGNKDRVVMLPRTPSGPLRDKLVVARSVWELDRASGLAGVEVPHALEAKYPKVGQTWRWLWVFPSPTMATDPHSGVIRRHHVHQERLARALKAATAQAQIVKRVWAHTLRQFRDAPAASWD